MTTLNRAFNLYLNSTLPGGRNALLEGTSSNPPNVIPSFMEGDRFALRLYFRVPVLGALSTPIDLAANYSLVLSGKLNGSLKTSPELFRTSDWVKGGDYYEGVLDLNTPAMLAAMATETGDDIAVAIDIEYRDQFNQERMTFRADVIVSRQVYAGGMAPSTLATTYLQSPDGSTWQVTIDDNGQRSVTKVGDDQRDPAFIITSAAVTVSPSGYYFQMTIDDNGQENIERIQ